MFVVGQSWVKPSTRHIRSDWRCIITLFTFPPFLLKALEKSVFFYYYGIKRSDLMEREEIRSLFQTILEEDSQAERSTQLETLRSEVEGCFSQIDTLTSENEKLEQSNKDLVTANSKLFAKIGVESQSGSSAGQDKPKKLDLSKMLKGE